MTKTPLVAGAANEDTAKARITLTIAKDVFIAEYPTLELLLTSLTLVSGPSAGRDHHP